MLTVGVVMAHGLSQTIRVTRSWSSVPTVEGLGLSVLARRRMCSQAGRQVADYSNEGGMMAVVYTREEVLARIREIESQMLAPKWERLESVESVSCSEQLDELKAKIDALTQSVTSIERKVDLLRKLVT